MGNDPEEEEKERRGRIAPSRKSFIMICLVVEASL